MKHTIGWLAHALCLAAILLAIWVPFGGRGQWIATAVVLLLLGAMLLGSTAKTTYAEGGEIPNSVTYSSDIPEHLRSEEGVAQLRDGEVLSGTGDEELDEKLNARPKYGKRAE